MKTIVALLLLLNSLYADMLESVTPTFFTSLTSEYEQALKKESNPDFVNDYTSIYNSFSELGVAYDINDYFYTLAGAKLNYELYERLYNNDIYAEAKQSKEELNRAALSEASLNYDSGFVALNMGRNLIQYNFLDGSMDGIITMIGSQKSYSLRLFYLQNFQQFFYNFFQEDRAINDAKGLYGAIATLHNENFDVELFDYLMPSLKNTSGSSLRYNSDNFAFNLFYTYLTSYSALINDEMLTFASFEYLFNENYIEVGGLLSGKEGHNSLLEFGNHLFTQFYLVNQTYRSDAKNLFLKYIYTHNAFQFESLFGATEYASSFLSYELDLYLRYTFTKRVSLELGAIYMDVDKKDPLETSKTSIITNLVYEYESF